MYIPLRSLQAFVGAEQQVSRVLRYCHKYDIRVVPRGSGTWPLWMYVSVSGVAVYLMLYQLYR